MTSIVTSSDEEIIIDLPQPSGSVVYRPLKNSFGGVGVYYVGDNEFEDPDDDVAYARQFLADALEARRHHQAAYWDRLASAARETWIVADDGYSGSVTPWEKLDPAIQETWREVVRVVIKEHREDGYFG